MTYAFAGRREDVRLVTGAGQFTDDWSLPGQARGVFLRADRAHADIVRLDVAAARAAPGVLLILTGAEAVAAGFDRNNPNMPVTGRGGMSLHNPARPALASERVRYVGEPVALVVAETEAAAQDAAELIVIEYADRPAVVGADAAEAADAALVHAAAPGNVAFDYEYGDAAATDAAFARAATVVRLTLRSDRVVGAPMEPKAAMAAWRDGTVDLWTASQGMIALRDSLAGLTGLDPAAIRIRAQDVGGAFGIRGAAYPEHAALVLAAREAGRPVKWVATRSETFLSDYQGRGIALEGELALDADGRFLAIRHHWRCDMGAWPVAAGPLISTLNPAGMCTGCYAIPAVHGRSVLLFTNAVPVTAYRGAGRPDMAYMIERLVDEAAAVTGRDRLALRRLNAVPPDAFPYTLPTGPNAASYDSGEYAALLEAATDAADWGGFEARRAAAAAQGKRRGIGCALFVEPAGGVVPKDEVAITFDAAGDARVHTVAHASGQGHETVFPEIVARVFGTAPDRVSLHQSEPEGPVLAGGGAFGSRTMMTHGAASDGAAREVVRKGMQLASEALEAAVADLEFDEGSYRIAGTDRAVTLDALARRYPGALDTVSALPAGRAFPSGAHVAEVEIDPETGVTALLRYTAVDDCGVVLNPTLLDGQIVGGMLQGIGQALGERCVYDADGQMLSGSFMDYAMPHADMLTDIDVLARPVPSPSNPLGAKGAGEAGTTGALPAVMNAVVDALRADGVSHVDMPASPQRVWQALRGAG